MLFLGGMSSEDTGDNDHPFLVCLLHFW